MIGKARELLSGRPARGRRTSLRAEQESLWRRGADALASPRVGAGVLIALVFAAAASAMVLWTRAQPLVAVGRVMDETRLVRVNLELEDREQTEENRRAARQNTPRVYTANVPQLEELEQSLLDLPQALSAAASIEAVDATIRANFALDAEMLDAVKAAAKEPERWRSNVGVLAATLRRRPLLDSQTYQQSLQSGSSSIKLVVGDTTLPPISRGEVINADSKQDLGEAMNIVARDSGFTGALRRVVVNRLTTEAKPTFRYDAAATARDQNDAADRVPVAKSASPPGQTIVQRGEVLTPQQEALFRAEMAAYSGSVEGWKRWLTRGAVVLAVSGLTMALLGYTVLFCPRIRRNISRMIGVAAILLGSLGIACVLSATFPGMMALTAVAPTILVTLLLGIGYDRRAALAYGLLHGLFVCVAVRAGVGTMVVIVTGIACVVTTIGAIRDRSAFVRLSVVTALGVAIATATFGVIDRPLLSGVGGLAASGSLVLREILLDSAFSAGGALVLGGAVLFVLGGLERMFDVATGLTLIELRDPKHPLLRELQLRAPGTYNHALNVAALAESAAEAIKADGLLTYVGALYHDVGKVNKPEYFIENQVGGPSKHDKLSPAMSLLVVVGHVKDGMELARDYALPRQIQHFIESHHGTTLVEYFYHRAKKLAGQQAGQPGGGDEESVPDEIEYRYPGPRPRTKEAAVLMICDAVESATRAMSEPTPSRIEALVRSLANKRLLDGQFDDCELTLRELTTIVESVSRSLASMYHGRIAYPAGETPRTTDSKPAEMPRTQDMPASTERKVM